MANEEIDPNYVLPKSAADLDENEPDLFSRLTSDWRNIALLALIAVVVILGAMRFMAGPNGEQAIAMVGGKVITEKNVVTELKHQAGDQVLIQMISDELLMNYAKQKNIVVTDAEIDQFIKFQQASLELSGRSIDKFLEERGQNMEEFRKLVKMTLLQIKLIVPPEDIKAALVKYGDKLALPERYRFRDFTYLQEADAKKAVESFKKPDGLQEGSLAAINAKTAMNIQTVVAKELETRTPEAYAALKTLQPGSFSAPVSVKSGGFHVLQLVEIVPEEKATLENRGAVVGQQLVSEDRQKYSGKIEDLKAEALYKVDTQIISADYPKAHDQLLQMKQGNPYTSVNTPGGAPAAPGRPAAPGAPSSAPPAARPQAPPAGQ